MNWASGVNGRWFGRRGFTGSWIGRRRLTGRWIGRRGQTELQQRRLLSGAKHEAYRPKPVPSNELEQQHPDAFALPVWRKSIQCLFSRWQNCVQHARAGAEM